MARIYLSDTIEQTWEQPEHQTFVTLAERIDDYLNAEAVNDDIAAEADDEPNWCDGCMGWCAYDY